MDVGNKNNKTKVSLFIVSIVMLFLIGTVYAESYPEMTDGQAKSKKDPLFIEMPENVHQMTPVNVKVYINDPLVKSEANYVEISSGSSSPYGLSSKITFDPSGAFRQTMPYNGEETIDYGFRPMEYFGQSSSTYVSFYKTKKVSGREYPDTSSQDSEFKGYQCHIETNKLLCSEKEGCIICAISIGSAMKEFQVSSSLDEVSPPSRFKFTNAKDSDPSLKEYAPHYESFSYSEKKEITGNNGEQYPYTDAYTISLDITNNPYATLQEQKDGILGNYMIKQQGMILNAISAPGGSTGGYAFEGISYKKPDDKGRHYDYVNVNYEMYAEMQPKGSGMMKVTASRSTAVGFGNADSEKDKVISEAKAFAASHKILAGSVSKPTRELSHTYYIRGKAKEIEETTELSVFGTVSDADSNPLPFIELEAVVDGNTYTGKTDENGDFSILLTGLNIKEGEEKDCKLRVIFNYNRDGKNYFKLYTLNAGTNYIPIIGAKKFKIKGGENYELNLKFDGSNDPDLTTSKNPVSNLKHYGVIYYHMHESVDFAIKKLNANIDYKLPVEVYIGNNDGDTLYDPSDSSILISSADAGYGSTNKPKNREYHEFAHHIMYAQYGAWPEGRSVAGSVNHDGFMNPNTADSYMEGFAEFIAMAIAKENGDKTPEIYASFGSLENNYKPWDSLGQLEEFAVASLLWDMYDPKNDIGDSLTVSLEDIWKVIKVKRADFYEYYKAFNQEFPKQKTQIDALFIAHGFFDDTRVGNKKFDSGEPWKYINSTAGTYKYIDMSGNVTKIEYVKGFTIGKATNYNRSNRTSAVRVDNAFIKVDDENVDFYIVKVDYKGSDIDDYEYEIDLREGLLYVQPLPYDANAVITVRPKSTDFTSNKIYSIDSKELNSKISNTENSLGYIAEHNFELKATGSKNDVRYETFGDSKPTYDYEGDLGKKVEKNIVYEDEESSDSTSNVGLNLLPIFVVLFIVVVVVGTVIYVLNNKKKHKHK